MKVDLVLVPCDMNINYLSLWPLCYFLWNNVIKIPVKLILVAESIPNFLKKYENDIILFKPIENIHTAFIAQCIRLFIPALLKTENNIMISDIDFLPLQKSYFDNLKDIDNDSVVLMRDAYHDIGLYAINYVCMKPKKWSQIFNINSLEDINNILKEWYEQKYSVSKGNPLWYTDQRNLKIYVEKWAEKNDGLIFLKDKKLKYESYDIKRVRGLIEPFIDKNNFIDNIKNKYTNVHCNHPNRDFYILKLIMDNFAESRKYFSEFEEILKLHKKKLNKTERLMNKFVKNYMIQTIYSNASKRKIKNNNSSNNIILIENYKENTEGKTTKVFCNLFYPDYKICEKIMKMKDSNVIKITNGDLLIDNNKNYIKLKDLTVKEIYEKLHFLRRKIKLGIY